MAKRSKGTIVERAPRASWRSCAHCATEYGTIVEVQDGTAVAAAAPQYIGKLLCTGCRAGLLSVA